MLGIIFGSVLAGLAAGFFAWLPDVLMPHLDALITYGVCVVVFAVGVDIGRNRAAWLKLKSLGVRALLLPGGVIVGTLAGAALVPVFLSIGIREALAVGAGFGWYSLSGVMLTKLHSPQLGAVAFLSNVFRELLTVVLVPILARHCGPFTVIAPGGATTMDTTLPLIDRFTGPHGALLAFINGLILSSLVPVLVPLFAG